MDGTDKREQILVDGEDKLQQIEADGADKRAQTLDQFNQSYLQATGDRDALAQFQAKTKRDNDLTQEAKTLKNQEDQQATLRKSSLNSQQASLDKQLRISTPPVKSSYEPSRTRSTGRKPTLPMRYTAKARSGATPTISARFRNSITKTR